MKDEFERYLKHAHEHFKDHKATLLHDSDDFTIIDWRNADGRGDYFINFIVDKRRGSLHVDGDLGSSVATWHNPLKISDLKSYIYNNIGYYMSKFQCASNDYCYEEEDVFNDLVELLERESVDSFIELSDDYDDFEEFKEAVMNEIGNSIHDNMFIPTEKLYEIATDIYEDAWEGLTDCGKAISGRVYLWAIGFNIACEQLGI